jgi:hypothetical protein
MANLDLRTIARHIAGDTWGHPVDHCFQLVPGVFNAHTPGHGGIVAILAAADLPEPAVQAARMTGRLRRVEGVGDVWVAEEDCEVFTLFCSCPAVLHAYGLLDADHALAEAQEYCPDFVTAYRALTGQR